MKNILRFLFAILSMGLVICLLFYFPTSSNPPLTKPVVTVINPIRGQQLGLEHSDLLAGLKSQWSATKDENVKATWLWQYSALEDKRLVNFAKSQMTNQEFGIFLEIDRIYSQQTGILYRGYGPWYFSDGLLLTSYDKGERERLIDAVFTKFKQTFGYYPKTVGAWWVGADSLEYMKQKYGIIASLQVADQYDLDVYSVWGTPWSSPFVSAKKNATIPAASPATSSNVVIMQWAPRDPTDGYGNTPQHSTYSMQDYYLKKYDISYVDYLFNIFLKKPGDQVVIGLEAGLSPKSYQGEYKQKLQKIKNLQQQQKIEIQTAGQFAERFLTSEQSVGEARYLLTKAYKSNDQSFWYHSGNFRAGILKKGNEIFLVDVRDYSGQEKEDFSVLPNSQGYLRVSSPAIIDSARFSEQQIHIATVKEKLTVKTDGDKVMLMSEKKPIALFTDNSLNLPTINKSFLFKQKTNTVNIFLFLFIVLLIYTGLLFLKIKQKGKIFLHGITLFSCLLFAYPFLSSGQLNQLTLLFDQKQLFLLPLIKFLPFDLPIRFILIFQIMPFFVLLLLNYISIVREKIKYIYVSGIALFILFYTHVPENLVTEFITRKKIAFIMLVTMHILVSFGALLLVYKKQKKLLTKTFLFVFVSSVLMILTLLFSWQKFVITPFEKESLEYIAAQQKDVYYVMPKIKPVYRAVTPLLFNNRSFAESITRTKWSAVSRSEGAFLSLDTVENMLIVVPKYLGSELYVEEIKEYKLKKIFDNTQIMIFMQESFIASVLLNKQ